MPEVENKTQTSSLFYPSAVQSQRSSTSEQLQTRITPSTVPESIFGWPAVTKAIQSAITSLPALSPRVFVDIPDIYGERGFSSKLRETDDSHIFCSTSAISQHKGSVELETSVNTSGRTTLAVRSENTRDLYRSENNGSIENMFSMSSPASGYTVRQPLAFTSLPDELIAMCCAELEAADLVALEHVSRRLRELVAYDTVCWRRCTEVRWGHMASSASFLASAARYAGTWKQLYSEKAATDRQYTPWLILSKSEMRAILDVIKGATTRLPPMPHWPSLEDFTGASSPPKHDGVTMTSSSPVSVMTCPPAVSCFSVILLVDASSSVTDDDFDAMKTFSRALVDDLRSCRPESHVAVVQFNQHPKVEVALTNVCKTKLSASIDDMEQLMGSTDIAAPIRLARQMLSDDARPGERAIILLTDGQTHADELQESEREARKAWEDAGARLYTLGVGRDIDEAGLTRVAAGSEGGMYFTLRRLMSSK